MSNKVRKFPAVDPGRVETGPIQFGDDWPGVFIRGDNALAFAHHLRSVLHVAGVDPIQVAIIRGLISDLESCFVP